ncbi:D-ribose pyranase [Paenibacillus thalictri]|uniref:D-ribose pyranase n=1 Tax=Paenibacillus thalictri TaxID=2527873 RepID=A0A4Q9DJM1_9BACL|nr:D-ribose pyranase [Paenibacillus thalictri]TBL74597.1 D-ribose pyranase [Paenibacillus thalictri]
MKKTALLNSEISYVIAKMGHLDMIAIGDCGLPVPSHVPKIDIALTAGVPGFIETLQAVLSELHVEKAWVASELVSGGSPVYGQLTELLQGVQIGHLPHETFKTRIAEYAVAVIRTGECTPYANVILQSGVTF